MNDSLTNLAILSSVTAKDLKNTYSVIAVDPAKYPNVNFAGAKALIYFMLEQGQAVIQNYTIHGQHPFSVYPNYGANWNGTSPTNSSLDEVFNGMWPKCSGMVDRSSPRSSGWRNNK